MSIFDWPEREKVVIELYKKGISPKEIAHEVKMSLRDVYKIIKKEFRAKEKELTTEHQAIILFLKGKRPVVVALKLRISLDEANQYYIKYIDSLYLGQFGQDYKYLRGYAKEVAEVCFAIKNGGLTVKELLDGYHLERDLGQMEERHLYLV